MTKLASSPIPGNFSPSLQPALDSPAAYTTLNVGWDAHRRSTSPPPYPETTMMPTRMLIGQKNTKMRAWREALSSNHFRCHGLAGNAAAAGREDYAGSLAAGSNMPA